MLSTSRGYQKSIYSSLQRGLMTITQTDSLPRFHLDTERHPWGTDPHNSASTAHTAHHLPPSSARSRTPCSHDR